MTPRLSPGKLLLLVWLLAAIVVSCVTTPDSGSATRHRWWTGLGPVLPHDTFPADCKMCHVGETWDVLTDDFEFDHEAETGVPLNGAHEQARCLHCHNDRGPVEVFHRQGCGGCHEDFHQGELGSDCTMCHREHDWRPVGQIAMHNRTRFPLVGAHTGVACWRCHPGGEVGNFLPVDTECVSCHRDDLARTTNHINLGWVDRCDRCHLPTFWDNAEVR